MTYQKNCQFCNDKFTCKNKYAKFCSHSCVVKSRGRATFEAGICYKCNSPLPKEWLDKIKERNIKTLLCEGCRKITNERVKNGHAKQRGEIISLYGAKCQRCGFNDKRALHIDHVNGGGTRELRAIGTGIFNRKVIEECGNGEYQLLCANCNFIKAHENNEKAKPHVWVDLGNLPSKKTISGWRGVRPERGKWRAAIKHKGKVRFGGTYPSPREAALAYNEMAMKLFGSSFLYFN